MTAQLRWRQRLSRRARAHERAEDVVGAVGCLRPSDHFVRVGAEYGAVTLHLACAFTDGERDEPVELAQLSADPSDHFALMVRDLLRSRRVEVISEHHPCGEGQRDATHRELEIDGRFRGNRAGEIVDDHVDAGEARFEGFLPERGRDGRLQAGPRLVALCEEVLADTDPYRDGERRRPLPRAAVGHEHRSRHLGVGDHPRRNRTHAHRHDRPERGGLVEPTQAVGVEELQPLRDRAMDA